MATTIENLILKIKVDGQKAIDGVSNSIKNLSDDIAAFGSSGGAFSNSIGGIIGKLGPLGLAAATAGGAIAALGLKATQIAGEIKDIADATGISAGSLLNFKQSLLDAGGSADSFSKFAAKLNQSVGEANEGNEKFQESFRKLGVFVRNANGELRPTGDILEDVLAALSKMENPAARSAAAVALLGKEAAKIDWSNVKAGRDAVTDQQIEQLDKYNQAIDKMRNRLERGIVTFFGSAAQQANDFFDTVDKRQKELEKQRIELGNQGKMTFQDPFSGKTITGNMTPAEKKRFDLEQAQRDRKAYEAEMDKLMKPYQSRAGIRGQTTDLGGDYGPRSEAGQKAAAESAKRAQQSIIEAQKSAELQGLGEIARIRKQAEYDIQKEILNIRAQEKLTDPEKEAEIAAKTKEIRAKADLQVADALEKQNKQLRGMTTEFEKQQILARNKLDLETQLVGKSEEEAQMMRAQRQLALDYAAAQEQLIKQRDSLGRGEEAQAAKINQLIEANAEAYTRQAAELEKSITANQSALLIEKDRLANIERITAAYEQQQRVQEALGNIQRAMIAEQQSVSFEGAQAKRSPFEKQIEQIKESSRKAALEAGRAFAAAFEDTGDGMTPEQAKKFADGLKLIEEGYAAISTKQIENLEASRTWSAGWEEAFKKYRDDASNAATQSATYFETFTRGMEDAFVKFVQTGKLSFKDLANSLIADFARIQAKKALMGLFGGGSSGGGFFSSIGNWFSGLFRAEGGPVSANSPYIVGERGPELFVPRSSGNIVPNGEFGGGGSMTTNVTYSIQAVDAASFQQLVARDPKFLHAVVEKGKRSLPQGARQ